MMLRRPAIGALCWGFFSVTMALGQQDAKPGAAASSPNASAAVSIWDGVYTSAQAARGKEVHAAVCSRCHGLRLDGAHGPDQPESPPIARSTFLAKWDGRTVDSLFAYVKAAMPPQAPGSRTDQQYIDAVAYMLAVSNIPTGQTELTPDPNTRANIVIKAQR